MSMRHSVITLLVLSKSTLSVYLGLPLYHRFLIDDSAHIYGGLMVIYEHLHFHYPSIPSPSRPLRDPCYARCAGWWQLGW